MLRDITLGQYYQTDSVIHKLDPRVKLIATIAFIISLFVVKSWVGYVVAAVFLAVVIRLSHVPFRYMVKGMKAIVFIMLITVVFNLFLTPGEVLVSFWKIRITKEGLRQAVTMAVRLSFLIVGSSVMTLTTTPNSLTDAMEKLMKPLRVFKVPVHEVAMMMSIALRFIPILLEETDKIMKAQIARGADFESGNLIKKAKAMVPLLVPLLISFGSLFGSEVCLLHAARESSIINPIVRINNKLKRFFIISTLVHARDMRAYTNTYIILLQP